MDNLIFKLPVPDYKSFMDPCPPFPFTGITLPTRPSRSPGSSQTAVLGEESLAVPAKAIPPDFSSNYFSSFSPLLLQLANLQSLLQSFFFPLNSVGVHCDCLLHCWSLPWCLEKCLFYRNGRLQYAQELAKYIGVDIYGACGSLR